MEKKVYLKEQTETIRRIMKLKKEINKETLRKYRMEDIKNSREYWKEAKENFEKNDVFFYFCKTSKDAKELLSEIVEFPATASKTTALKEAFFDANPTDFGDFLTKNKKGLKNPIQPAFGENLEEILKEFNAKNEEELKEKVKKMVKENIEKSKTGITGANFITKEGFVVLIENEGNIGLVARRKKHVVVTTYEKITESLEKAVFYSKVASLFATGKEASYFDIISSPSKTADLMKIQKGMYGSEEMHVLVIDNKRSEMIGKEDEELLYCIGCGTCSKICPLFFEKDLGVVSQGVKDMLTRKVLLKDNWMTTYCIGCGLCKECCPLGIDLSKHIKNLRKVMFDELKKNKDFDELIKNLEMFGNPFGKEKKVKDKLYCC